MVRSSPVRKITTNIGGVTHEGEYYTHDRTVIVHYRGQRKETWFRDDGAVGIAHLLLGELVREEQTRQSRAADTGSAG
jgi:hypothetical protein